MKQLSMDFGPAAALTSQQRNQYQKLLEPEIERLWQTAQTTGYQTKYASVQLPFDAALMRQVTAMAQEKQQLKPAALIVIGIGGSSLGAKAVHEALNGLYYNEITTATKLYFVETVDTDTVADVLCLAEMLLKSGKHILVNVISKSGSTTETIANYELFVQLLKKYHATRWHQYVVATTDKDSLLWQLAEQHSIAHLAIPASVGGRYSVFSAVGLFPLACVGIDLENLLLGAQNMVTLCTQSPLNDNPAALSAALLVDKYHQQITLHDMFLFSAELGAVGSWYRQLMAESLGKLSYEHIEIGITPTVSIGSTDLHSVGQLYLGGPRKTCTTFVTIATYKNSCSVPEYEEFERLVGHIQGKPLTRIMDAIIHGTLRAYDAKKLAYTHIQLPEKSAYYVGQLLQLKMIEIIYVGFLLKVNPFDQPHVEQYKVITRKMLAHE